MSQVSASANGIFVGRQPIFDRQQKVYGYELLYRDDAQTNAYSSSDPNGASSRLINSSLNTLGIQELVGNKRAFVNITRELLVSGDYSVMPKDRVVIELLETVEPDEEVVAACKKLKQDGFTLALDDFVFTPAYAPLLEIADILKIDFLMSDKERRRSFVKEYGGRIGLLAEKVETPEDLDQAMSLGYSYFQGYFFCKPEIIAAKEVPAVKQNYLRFIQLVNEKELDFDRLELAVKCEVSLSTKLLRYLNSASVGLGQKLTSIRQGLTLLGESPLRKWATLIAVGTLGEDKPTEIMAMCLTRARFCELLGPEIGLAGRELDMFLMGLFSAMDVLMGRPMNELAPQMPVQPDVAAALMGVNNALGRAFGLAVAFERGNTVLLESRAAKVGIAPEKASAIYQQAVAWACKTLVA